MMDTILNLGLHDRSVEGLAAVSGDRRFALDSYRRFIQMYSGVVLGIPKDDFEHLLTAAKKARKVKDDTELTAKDLEALVAKYKATVQKATGRRFPQDPHAQLWGAIAAVFSSWDNERARLYRRQYGIPDNLGTAVNVQSMVYGNLGDDCATGVAFTRNPATGENVFFGEFLPNAQGEDVVAGIRTPRPISRSQSPADGAGSLEATMPACYQQLLADPRHARGALRRHAGHRVHDRARHALHAADAHREAHGARGGEHRLRLQGSRRHRHQDAAPARRGRHARSASGPDLRRQGEGEGEESGARSRKGAPRGAGRRVGRRSRFPPRVRLRWPGRGRRSSS